MKKHIIIFFSFLMALVFFIFNLQPKKLLKSKNKVIENEKIQNKKDDGLPTPYSTTSKPYASSTNGRTPFANLDKLKAEFNLWKNRKEELVKAIYPRSSTFQKDFKLFSKGSKSKWLQSKESDSYYLNWRDHDGQSILTNYWKTKTDYFNKRGLYLSQGSDDKRSKSIWINSNTISKSGYHIWRKKQKTPLKQTWEQTILKDNNFKISFKNFVVNWKNANSQLDTKLKFSNDQNTVLSFYDQWRLQRTPNLKNAWEQTTTDSNNFLSKLNDFKVGWKKLNSNLDTKLKFLNNNESNTYYDLWRLTKPISLGNKWENTTIGSHSFITKFNTFTNAWKSKNTNFDSKTKFADHNDSNNYYDEWRIKRSDELKQTWEQTQSGPDEYQKVVDDWFIVDKPLLKTKTKWLASSESTQTYEDWKNSSSEAQLKSIWEQSDDFKVQIKNHKSFDDYLNEDGGIIGDYILSNLNNRNVIGKEFRFNYARTGSSPYYATLPADSTFEILFKNLISLVESNAYLWPTFSQDFSSYSNTGLKTENYYLKWQAMLQDQNLNNRTNLKRVLIDVYKDFNTIDLDNAKFLKYAKSKYKLIPNKNNYDTAFSNWKNNSLENYWRNSQNLTNLGYLDFKSNAFNSDLNLYNPALDKWSRNKNKGLSIYKNSSQLNDDYSNYIKNKYHLASEYGIDLNNWSSNKNNGLDIYQNTIQLDNDYIDYIKTKYRLNNQYNIDLDIWSRYGTNPLKIYQSSNQIDIDYLSYIKSQYQISNQYIVDLNKWSSIYANAKAVYENDPDSTKDYNSWDDPYHRTIQKYDNNHLGQFEKYWEKWTNIKSNGVDKYNIHAQSNTDFYLWKNPNKKTFKEYYESNYYLINFNNFVINDLTWKKYASIYLMRETIDLTNEKKLDEILKR